MDGWMDGLEDLMDNLGATAWTGDDGIQSFLSLVHFFHLSPNDNLFDPTIAG